MDQAKLVWQVTMGWCMFGTQDILRVQAPVGAMLGSGWGHAHVMHASLIQLQRAIMSRACWPNNQAGLCWVQTDHQHC